MQICEISIICINSVWESTVLRSAYILHMLTAEVCIHEVTFLRAVCGKLKNMEDDSKQQSILCSMTPTIKIICDVTKR